MRIFAIGDLHLSFSCDKPMHVFGSAWENHVERLEEAWQRTVLPEDTVLIPGDISWAMHLPDAAADLAFIPRQRPRIRRSTRGSLRGWSCRSGPCRRTAKGW